LVCRTGIAEDMSRWSGWRQKIMGSNGSGRAPAALTRRWCGGAGTPLCRRTAGWRSLYRAHRRLARSTRALGKDALRDTVRASDWLREQGTRSRQGSATAGATGGEGKRAHRRRGQGWGQTSRLNGQATSGSGEILEHARPRRDAQAGDTRPSKRPRDFNHGETAEGLVRFAARAGGLDQRCRSRRAIPRHVG